MDKVLTHNIPHISLASIKDKYEKLPINLSTVNNFNCETLFCSELLCDEIIDTTKFYQILSKTYNNSSKITKFIEKCKLITPEDCVWYYGKSWEALKAAYTKSYNNTVFDDKTSSPYYKRAKHYINIK